MTVVGKSAMSLLPYNVVVRDQKEQMKVLSRSCAQSCEDLEIISTLLGPKP